LVQKRPDKHHHGGHPKKPPGTHNNSPEELAAINETLKAFSERYEEDKEKNPGRDSWKFRIEIATALGVGIYTLITAGLFIAALYQIAIMQDTERRQLRAYVGVAPGDIEDFGGPNQRLRVVRKNSGLTPAYNIGFSAAGFGTIKPGESINTGPEGCAAYHPVKLATMFPGLELPLTIIITDKYSPEEIQLVKSGNRQFVYFGNICYHDAFGAVHFTNYCWMYKGTSMTAKDADACLGHNDSD
jgi:hypothetical protein